MNITSLSTFNPANGEKLHDYPTHSDRQIASILAASHQSFLAWRKSSWKERESFLFALSDQLTSNKQHLAELIRLEMGKLEQEALSEIEKCAKTARYYAENGEQFLQNLKVETEATKSYVAFMPLGPVLAIMPWNFPFWQAIRCAAPAIAAGNTVVLKHASNVSGCSLALQDIIRNAAGRPLLRSLIIPGEKALSLVHAKEIAAVSFTGSSQVGKKVAAQAGSALKKAVLELGGSDPYLILEDADIELAAKACATSRLICAGQSCIAAKRFIVASAIKDDFLSLLKRELSAAPIAPLARDDLRKELQAQVDKSIALGAKLALGGKIMAQAGYYYPATILDQVKPGMPAFDEELFGPVAAIIEAKDENEAIALANQTAFGLGSAIFSRNIERAEEIAGSELQSGSAFVNTFVRSDPRLPFGGIKESGYGRELSHFGMHEFVNIKTIYVQTP